MTRAILCSAFMIFALQGCNDGDSDDDFPDRIGIRGRVLTQNEFQQPLYEERSDIDVVLEVGFRSFPLDGDNVGRYQIAGAPVGTYTATFAKEGYGTVIVRSIPVSTVNPEYPVEDGYQVLPTYTITRKPITQFENINLDLSYEVINSDTIWQLDMGATLNPPPPPTGQAQGYRLFIGTDEFLSKDDFLFQKHYTTTSAEIAQSFDNQFFDTLNIRSGDVIYALLYGDANFDFEQKNKEGLIEYPNLSEEPSDLQSVALP